MKFTLLALALYNGANGLVMLFASRFWYDTVPGAAHTGPFNPHFVPDIAFGFLAAAGGLVVAAFTDGRTRAYPLAPAAVFLGGHALLHVYEWTHHSELLLFEAAAIVVPGLLPVLFIIIAIRKA